MKRTIPALLLVCCMMTIAACGSTEQTKATDTAAERPYNENMSQEQLTQTTNDTIDFILEIGQISAKMAELSQKYADEINSSDTFDWSQYWDFRETKEEAMSLCDEILAYDDSNCSKELQLCVDEYKSMAYQLEYFFNTVSKEMDEEELLTLTVNLTNNLNLSSNYATTYHTMAIIAYMEDNDGDPTRIAVLKEQVSDSYLYKVTRGSGSSSAASSGTSGSRIIFTNSYGTATTTCAQSGCKNPIATSGDTNCCMTHSNKCYNCGKYIDGDTMFCMSCLSGKTTTLEDTGKYSSSASAPKGGCEYSYFDGSVCGKSCNKYASLCDSHFKELYDTYQSLIGE